MIGRIRSRRKKISQKTGKSDKSWINVYNIYLFYYLICYFMFPRRKVSSEQIFQRKTFVDYSGSLFQGYFCKWRRNAKESVISRSAGSSAFVSSKLWTVIRLCCSIPVVHDEPVLVLGQIALLGVRGNKARKVVSIALLRLVRTSDLTVAYVMPGAVFQCCHVMSTRRTELANFLHAPGNRILVNRKCL